MTVYVDDWRQQAKVGRHSARWSHMFSDSSDEELHALAARIGLKRSYFQKPNDPLQTARHYDVTENKRLAAISAGAVEISWRDGGRMRSDEREALRTAEGGSR